MDLIEVWDFLDYSFIDENTSPDILLPNYSSGREIVVHEEKEFVDRDCSRKRYCLNPYFNAEKNEIREEKLVLKANKERIEQQLKTLNVSAAGYLPAHPAGYHAAANKMAIFPGYGLVPMWQYLPPSARDTSQDHELRPPAA
ncbi:hypothetical protein GOBAR_DD04466 [Gossypium barbadense]|nr:hypothetical protein GOBAR_DD04466 [Gossypium barbadense]